MIYDRLGRMLTRKDYAPDGDDADTAPDLVGNATWTWDEATNGLGQVQTVTDTKSGHTRTLTYDTHGRADVTAVTPGTGAGTYYEKQTYDGYGRPYQHFDASRITQTWTDNVTEVKYNAYGYAHKWVDGVYENGNPKATYREITFQDARGNVTSEKLGGGALRTARTFDAKTGRIGAIRSTAGMVSERQDFGYTWDVLGNLTRRTDTDDKGTAVTTDDKTTTTLYIGSVEKVTYSGSLYEYKRYIAGGVVLVTEKHETTVKNGVNSETETETTQYLLKDHLGSISVITDALGAMVQELSYDSWGQRRHAATWGDLTALARVGFDTSRTYRGYTGHEMLDAVGIIHMNGRIYDPKLGRFMQADPVIQFPDFSQSHNRYSYVLNNPLAYTDPSGYFIGKLFKKVFKGLNKALGDFAPFLGIALLAIAPVHAWVMQSWVNAFQFGFVTGGIATGSLRGAFSL